MPGMLGVLIVHLLTAAPGCQDRCAADTNRCYAGCGALPNCSRRCDSRTADCNAGCNKTEAKADAAAKAKEPTMPCGSGPVNGGKAVMIPCSESETKLYKDAMESPAIKQLLKCKDANGRATPCKDDLDRQKAVMRELSKDGQCKDEQGKAQVCPETVKKVQQALSAH